MEQTWETVQSVSTAHLHSQSPEFTEVLLTGLQLVLLVILRHSRLHGPGQGGQLVLKSTLWLKGESS